MTGNDGDLTLRGLPVSSPEASVRAGETARANCEANREAPLDPLPSRHGLFYLGRAWEALGKEAGRALPAQKDSQAQLSGAQGHGDGCSLGTHFQGSVLGWGWEFDQGSDVSCISQSKSIALVPSSLYIMISFTLQHQK